MGAVARDLIDGVRAAAVGRARARRPDEGQDGLTTAERDERRGCGKRIGSYGWTARSSKKPRPSSSSTRPEVRLDRRGEGLISRRRPLSESASGPAGSMRGGRGRNPRMPARSPVESAGAHVVRGEPSQLRQSARPRRSDRAGTSSVSRKRVVRLIQEEGLKARVRKRYKHTTMSDHDLPVAANFLERQFAARCRINAGRATPPSS